MTGQAHWIAFVPVALGLFAVALLFWRDAVEARRYRSEERRFLCPSLGRKISATLVRDASSGAVVGVRSCSGLASTASCGRACVPLFRRRPVTIRTAAA